MVQASKMCHEINCENVDNRATKKDCVLQVIGCLVNKVASSSIVKVMFVMMPLAMVTIMLTTI